MNYIEVTNVSYKIKSKVILDNVNLTVEKGDSFALIGTNGAGKTTLLDIILSDLNPTSGKVSLLGNSKYTFDDVGVLYDKMPALTLLKVKEMIKLFCVINKVNFNMIQHKYFESLEIENIKNSYIRELSQGERKRVGLLTAIIRNPRLLIMDEPFANLDPIMIERIWEILNEGERTILFSTHNWKEVGCFANKIAFIFSGKLIHKPQSANCIIESLPAKYKINTTMDERIVENIKGLKYYIYDNKINVFFDKNKDSNIIEIINQYSSDYHVRKVNLMDAYLYFSNYQ
jgi:ABC-type multidrug transport system ATPase subunit